ncbi:MAG: glycosyltransferase family 2 protein, partial [Stellaceae bacterium]
MSGSLLDIPLSDAEIVPQHWDGENGNRIYQCNEGLEVALQTRDRADTDVTLSIIIPMFNEAKALDRLFAELEDVLAVAHCSYEVVCVDDGSRDDTQTRLMTHRERNPAIKIVSLSRNFGKDIALTAGLAYCHGAAVLPFDADLQDPPSLIPLMLAKWRQGYDIVNAVRAERRGDGFLKRISATLFYHVYNTIADTKI